jgi:hypothetical protein
MGETTWSIGDEATLWVVSNGWALSPWQMGLLSGVLPEPFQPIPEETR